MKTFQEFQEQMLSAAERRQVALASKKSEARQRIRDAAWQRRHTYHELEMMNSREDQERKEREREAKSI